jgi:hypothetical protein
MSWRGASFYGETGKFCINCKHYVGGVSSRDDVCGLADVKCSRARMNVSQHDCGSSGRYFESKEEQE